MMLENSISLIGFIEGILMKNPDISNFSELQNALIDRDHSHLIKESIILNNSDVKNIVLKDIFSFYFSSKEIFKKKVERYRLFYALFNSCHNLRLFDLNSIEKILKNKDVVNTVYKKKEAKLRNSYEKNRQYKITSQKIDDILEKFLAHKPSIITPNLINTLIRRRSYNFLYLILIDCPKTRKKFNYIKKFFQGFYILYVSDMITNKSLIFVDIRISFLSNKEKQQLYSIIYNNFKENIIYGKSFIWSGFNVAFSLKNYYDFNSKQFFYTKDLFKQYLLFIQNLLEGPLPFIQDKRTSFAKFWSKEKDLSDFVKKTNERVLFEPVDLNITQLKRLVDFHFNLSQDLCDIGRFKEIRQEPFFKKYVKSIKFIPAFQKFGLDQYYLYLHPTDMDAINFKELLNIKFQTIKYPLCCDDSNSLLINYIIPNDSSNIVKTYFNQLIETRQVIREYCLFAIKRVYSLFQFSSNLNAEGWNYNKDEFKKYLQNILFDSSYTIPLPKLKEFNIKKDSDLIFTSGDHEYKSLTQIYNWRSIDIKSYLCTRNFTVINAFTSLLRKNLIFPYLSLKSLELHKKIVIILPNIKREHNEKLINIFRFFNYGFIYEIEGEYLIHGFPKDVKFRNGLMIKLYLPKSELHEFERLFDLIFEYLEIKDYLILNDLINGKALIKSIFGNLNFLKEHNPLKKGPLSL